MNAQADAQKKGLGRDSDQKPCGFANTHSDRLYRINAGIISTGHRISITSWALMNILFLLIAAHALADYPLQAQYLSDAKCRGSDMPTPWWQALLAHSFIHGGFVALITGIWWLGAAEVVIHAVTDHLRCEKRIGINTDQAIHIGCKVVWAVIAVWVIK